MLHFVNSASIHISDGGIAAIWEKNFVRSLENLLVECAIVKDDIERDCFVSRVYCWFSEKLVERRDLPKPQKNKGRTLEELKNVMGSSGDHNHTLKALESSIIRDQLTSQPSSPSTFNPLEDRDLPAIVYEHSKNVKQDFNKSRDNLTYIKHSFPEVLKPRTDYSTFLPKIPGADENYGLVYNKPETEAEKKLHELWLARRRQ
jgi:hypothetical protein